MGFYIFRIFAHYYIIKILYLRLSPTETIDMKTIKIILLLLLVCANVDAQRVEDGYFIYEDDSRSAIVGLTEFLNK